MPLPYEKTPLGLEIPAYVGGEEDGRVMARNLRKIDELIAGAQVGGGGGASGDVPRFTTLSGQIRALADSGDLVNAYSPIKITPRGLTLRDLQRAHATVLTMSDVGVVELAPGATYDITADSITARLVDPGTGFTSAPTLTVSAPNAPDGQQAVLEAVVADGKVCSVKIINEGRGYTSLPTLTVAGGGGTGAVIELELVGLHWNPNRVGIIGNGAKLNAKAMTRGYAVHFYGGFMGPSVPIIKTLPFEWFYLIGPGDPSPSYNALNIAQNNPTDGILFGGGLGAVSAPGHTAPPTGVSDMNMKQVYVSGFRDGLTFGDRTYLIHFYACSAGRMWRTGINAICDLDAGENFTWVGGVIFNCRTSKSGVLRIVVTHDGANFTGAPTITIAPPPGAGTQATATGIVVGGRLQEIFITNEGIGYDFLEPPIVTITGGGGSGAKAVAVCHSTAVLLPPGGGVDMFFYGTSFDYNDQIATLFSGAVTITGHLEDNSALPMAYICPATRRGNADVAGLTLAGGGVGVTRAAPRKTLFVLDTFNGSPRASLIARCGFGLYGQDLDSIYEVTSAYRPDIVDFSGAVFNIGNDAARIETVPRLGQHFNQAPNGWLIRGAAGAAPVGWGVGSAPGLTITKEAGIGRQEERTIWLTRGGTPGGNDPLREIGDLDGGFQITEVRRGNTVYTPTTDYELLQNAAGLFVRWAPAGAEPAAGEAYRVMYKFGGAGIRCVSTQALNTGGATYMLRNTIPIRPGQRVMYDFYSRLTEVTAGNVFAMVRFLDGEGNLVYGGGIDSLVNRNAVGNNPPERSVGRTVCAPPGAQMAAIQFETVGFVGTFELGAFSAFAL